jgi:hypothetical protein
MKYRKTRLLIAALALSASAYASDTAFPDSYEPAGTGISQNTEFPFTAAVKQNGKWGAVNGEGKTVIPITYDKIALSLSDEEIRAADLASEDDRADLIEVKQENLRGFYDRSGKRIIPVSYETRSFWKEGFLAVEGRDKRIGFYKKDGTKLTDPVYESVSDFEQGMAIVKSGGKYGYIDKKGKEIAPLYQEAHFFADGLAAVKEKNKWGVIDETGAYVIAPTYSNAGPAYSDGLLAVRDNKEKWGFIDKEGRTVIPFQYKSVHPLFHESMTAVQAENKLWGFVDNTGHVTAEPQFKAVLTPFSEGLAGVRTIDGKAYAKTDGTIAFMADYDQLYPFEKGIAEVRKGTVSKEHIRRGFPISIGIGIGWGHWFYPRCYHHSHFGWGIGFPLWWPDYGYEEIIPAVEVKRGYIDNTGKVIAATSNDHVFPATENGILIYNNSRYGWVDRKGIYAAHTIYRTIIPAEDAKVLLAKDEDKKWGMLSMTDGKELAPFRYDDLKYKGNGMIAYKEDGRWGLMDTAGTPLTEPLYKSIGNAEDNRIPAKAKDGWLYLDYAGKKAITFEKDAEDVTAFRKGRAGVKTDGKWGLIDSAGKWICPPAYDDLDIL